MTGISVTEGSNANVRNTNIFNGNCIVVVQFNGHHLFVASALGALLSMVIARSFQQDIYPFSSNLVRLLIRGMRMKSEERKGKRLEDKKATSDD
jgi:hypothetical protein